MDTLVEIRGLRTWFQPRARLFSRSSPPVKALDGVDLDIGEGESVGLVGESGCGKTTLGRTILGVEKATAGSVRFRGHSLMGLAPAEWKRFRRDLQMIFQDPYSSLSPRMMIYELVTEGLREHGLLDRSPLEAARALLNEVGLGPDSLYRYPFEFSGGQRQRIGICRALAVRPSFVVCDEPVSSLDISVQAHVLNLLDVLRSRHGLSYLFISHDWSVVQQVSDRIAVMYLGRIVELGPAAAIWNSPRHPYTQALQAAVPVPGRVRSAPRLALEGEPPSPAHPPPGCPFHPRCPRGKPLCRERSPEFHRVDGVQVRCHLFS